MSVSGNNDRSAPDSANLAVSSTAESRKAAERERLAEALRANLGRRKAQSRDRGKPKEDVRAGGATSQAAPSGGTIK